MAHGKVRYVGEPIALVLADSAAIAEDALDAIEVDIEPLPPITDRHAAARDETLLFEAARQQSAAEVHAPCAAMPPPRSRTRPTCGASSSASIATRRVPMEPRGLLAEWDAAQRPAHVSGAAKVPFFNRRMLAKQIGLPEDAVDLVENDVGGGFGARGEFYPEDFLIPFAARHVGRPVKWTEDRRENLMATKHAREAECDIEIACGKDGTILGLRGQAWTDVGAYMRTNGSVAPRNIAQFMSGPYRIPNIQLDVAAAVHQQDAVRHLSRAGPLRDRFLPRAAVRLVAQDLGIDRVEFRRRNLVSKAEMPYHIAKISPYEDRDRIRQRQLSRPRSRAA